ncbi:uncharacterized protein LOC117525509 isoform X2 [Thalassophryne amazonica]|nr:uncharacterized protein LOC117525509 isoform X2 [Thalassophryne amazonica]
MTRSQDLLSNNMKRNARREDKSSMSLVSVSTASSNLFDPSHHRNIVLGHCKQFPAQMSSLLQDSNTTVSTENQSADLINSSITDDPNKTQSEFALSSQGCSQLESDERLLSPQQNTELPSPQTKALTLDLLSQTSEDTPYNETVIPESYPVLPGSRSPQLEQFIQDTLNPTLSESSDESPEAGDGYFKMVKPSTFEALPPEKLSPTEDTSILRESVPSLTACTEDTNQTDVGVTTPALFQESIQTGPEVVPVPLDQTKAFEVKDNLSICISSTEFLNTPKTNQSPDCNKELSFDSSFTFNVTHDSKYDDDDHHHHDAAETCSSSSLSKVSAKSHMAEEHDADLREEGSTTGIHQELHESNRSSEGVEEETSVKSLQDQLPYMFGDISLESLQTEDSCSQSLSDLTPETVTSAKHFSFGEPIPYPGAENYDPFWDEDRTATTQHSGEYLTVISETFASESSELEPRAEGSSSTSDEDYCIPPGYEEISVNYNLRPSQATEVVHSDTDSPVFEYSDPESYFDCKQGASDFSEVEPDEPKTETRSSGDQLQGHSIHTEENNKMTEKSLLSSGSEDYEDAPYIQDQSQNFHKESEEESVHSSGASDEEFSL